MVLIVHDLGDLDEEGGMVAVVFDDVVVHVHKNPEKTERIFRRLIMRSINHTQSQNIELGQ